MTQFRVEKDSMGEVQVPKNAFYGAQTQRAVDNFPISGIKMKRSAIWGLGLIKKIAAKTNLELGLLDEPRAQLIQRVSQEIIEGKWDDQFPIDIFQTGSGTSSNMNSNEVVSFLANQIAEKEGIDVRIHPNDHVNFGQSSNDVFPTALRLGAAQLALKQLIPGIDTLISSLDKKGQQYAHIAKTGKTHLMDAMPVTFKQVFDGYIRQLELAKVRVLSALERVYELPQGGTAVGTGINTHPEFGKRFGELMAQETGISFREADNHFEAQATLDAPAELSAQLKTFAVGLMKIANDFRWMNSGPFSGISEIKLAPLQPGSSIMPGKVNPVIEESVCMVCAQVIGNDSTVTIAAQSGNFELNVMFPVAAHNIFESLELLGQACQNFAQRSVDLMEVNEKNINERIGRNPILVTALNPIIGYDLAAQIAKKSYQEDRPLKEVALEMSDLSEEELDKALDPMAMTTGGFTK
jgi:fumarate hydratase class II